METALCVWAYGTGIFLAALVMIAILVRLAYAVTGKIAEAPWLDLIISFFTWIPWVAGGVLAGWIGLVAALTAQFLLMHVFGLVHGWIRRKSGRPTITRANSGLVGFWPNQIALFAQLPAVAAFVLVRVAELAVYPVLSRLARLPRYRQGEWVHLSRHKFDGLAGYDLLWCWYCDWMTGLWALGSEMLRNIESFWCPIRFASPEKCRNAALDFPDVEQWIPADGRIEDVVRLIEERYRNRETNSWWGHPDRKPK